MPNPLAIAGPIAAAIGGVREMMTGTEERKWVAAAALRFDNIGSEESTQIAGLIRENPRAADDYVKEYFGGWERLETGLRERQHRSRAEAAVAEVQGMTSVERGAASQQDTLLGTLDEVARGDMPLEMAQAVASTVGAPDSFNRALQLGPTPESAAKAVSHGMLESEPDRRINASRGVMLETVTDAEGKTTTKRSVVPGSDLDKLEKERPGGPWKLRIILHQNLERAGIKRDHPDAKVRAEYERAFREADLEVLSPREVIEAEAALRNTPYDVTPSALERMVAGREVQPPGGGGVGGGGGPDLPPR